MKLETNLKHAQIQTQKISIKQQYSLKILEMNEIQMRDEILSELEINPVLEASDEIYTTKGSNKESTFDLLLNYAVKEETLQEVLMMQLHTYRKKVNLELGEFIIESLDSNGYFLLPMHDVQRVMPVSEEEIEDTINVIQTFEPYGVGARSLQECILIQLSYKKHPLLKYAIIIVNEYLNELAENKLPLLASQLDMNIEEVNEVVKLIRTCNPKPASSYASSSYYVKSDARVFVEDGEIQIELFSTDYGLKISSDYETVSDQKIKKYLSKFEQQAKLLISSIEKRNVTLLGILHCIVKKQKDYFLHNGQLVGLTLKEVAEELDIHESTVSRTVSNKYIEFEEKTISLKYFFPNKLSSGDSVNSVQMRIKELVESENKNKPYSDQELSDLLLKEGMQCSRRTVSKYRTILGIASAAKRKQY